jgi:type IV secretory pathway VirB10-like protein
MSEHFEEFLVERRRRAERRRALFVGVLAFACVVLTVSNVLLALWLSGVYRRAGEDAARPAASIPLPEPPATLTPASTPPAVETAVPPAPSPPAVEPEPPSLPPRTASAPPRPTPPPSRASAVELPVTAEEVTAAWMVRTYGRDRAEVLARETLDFYDARSSEAGYWRRIVGRIAAR